MTAEDGEAGELVVKLRNMVEDLRDERGRMAGRLADFLDPDVPCTKCRGDDKSPGEETVQPNRFDPFEALDEIVDVLDHVIDRYISGGCREADAISNQVVALRAYITGMER